MYLRFKIYKKNGEYYLHFDQPQFIAYIENAVLKYLPFFLKKQLKTLQLNFKNQIAAEIEMQKTDLTFKLKNLSMLMLEAAILTYMALEYFFYLWI